MIRYRIARTPTRFFIFIPERRHFRQVIPDKSSSINEKYYGGVSRNFLLFIRGTRSISGTRIRLFKPGTDDAEARLIYLPMLVQRKDRRIAITIVAELIRFLGPSRIRYRIPPIFRLFCHCPSFVRMVPADIATRKRRRTNRRVVPRSTERTGFFWAARKIGDRFERSCTGF